MLPKEIAKMVPKNRLMAENEWRALGVQQSQGWIHYMIHGPGKADCKRVSHPAHSLLHLVEPHILLFRRPITDPEAAKKADCS